eukprot:Colp12_sorted_trinity150504_noHs@22793
MVIASLPVEIFRLEREGQTAFCVVSRVDAPHLCVLGVLQDRGVQPLGRVGELFGEVDVVQRSRVAAESQGAGLALCTGGAVQGQRGVEGGPGQRGGGHRERLPGVGVVAHGVVAQHAVAGADADTARVREFRRAHVVVHHRHVAAHIDVFLVGQRVNPETLRVAHHLAVHLDSAGQEHRKPTHGQRDLSIAKMPLMNSLGHAHQVGLAREQIWAAMRQILGDFFVRKGAFLHLWDAALPLLHVRAAETIHVLVHLRVEVVQVVAELARNEHELVIEHVVPSLGDPHTVVHVGLDGQNRL